MRGTGPPGPFEPGRQRFIPALAGNRLPVFSVPCCPSGSSPRLRGTGRICRQPRPDVRFIPALAGNRPPLSTSPLMYSVHPRACGEQWTIVPVCSISCGSSPRLRGTVHHRPKRQPCFRFIPALAGNSSRRPEGSLIRPVHPRACGEQTPAKPASNPAVGSSPRLRGTDTDVLGQGADTRFIPALAGNPLCQDSCRLPCEFLC